MRELNKIVIHCSATHSSMDIGAADIKKWHLDKGWSDIGYHYVIRRNGAIEEGRPVHIQGAHVKGHNASSIGVCIVGGVGEEPLFDNNFTATQIQVAKCLITTLRYMHAIDPRYVFGHRDLSPDRNGDGVVTPDEWLKLCPCLDVKQVLL